MYPDGYVLGHLGWRGARRKHCGGQGVGRRHVANGMHIGTTSEPQKSSDIRVWVLVLLLYISGIRVCFGEPVRQSEC